MTNNFIENQAESPDETIENIFGFFMSKVNTTMPCKVISFDESTNFVEIQAIFSKVILNSKDEEVEIKREIITSVPILFFSNSKFNMSFKPAKDDIGLAIFSQRSIDNYLETDGKTIMQPGEQRFHDENDAFFFPCGNITKKTKLGSIPDTLFLGKNDRSQFVEVKNNEVEIKGSEIIANSSTVKMGGSGASVALAKANTTDSNFSSIMNWIGLVNTALGTLGITIPPPSTSGVGSSVAKVTG